MKTKYENGDEVQMVIKTQKESQTGLFTNERLLMIKAGIVSYFSSIPKKFTGSARAIEMSGQVPKFTIAANQISKIQLKGCELSILVLKSKLISRDDFGQMVKGTKNIPQIQGSAKADGGGYQQWIFKSQDEEALLQFYHLINLFRTNNPNFQPHLAQMIEGFQKKKNPRKKTMEPSTVSYRPKQTQQAHRHSQVPQSKVSQFLEKQQKVVVPPPLPPSFQQEDILKQNISKLNSQSIQEIKIEQDIQSYEQQRLNMVKDKININNYPRMSIIEQKPGEDKVSQLSKVTNINRPITIQVIKTFQQPALQPQIKHIEYIQEELIQETKPVEESIQQKQQPKIILEQKKKEKKHQVQQQQILGKQKQKKAHEFLNQSLLDVERSIQFQVKQQKKQKVTQLIKSITLLHKNDHKSMAKSLGISVQQLVEFLRVNHQEQQDTWEFIQSQLARLVSFNKSNELKTFDLSTKLIQNYHILSDNCFNSGLKSYQLLDDEMSFDSYQQQNQNQNMIMQWLKMQVSNQLSKSFSTKIFNQFENKILMRKLVFNKKQIINARGSWIVNKGGYLQQFLAYLCLEKILKQLKQKQKGKFQFQCSEAFYINYKQYEALITQLKVNSIYPLRSIKALQFLSKSKGIRFFQRCFPQFTINVQILKTESIYKFSLQRISDSFLLSPIQKQLKKIDYVIETQFQQYYNSVLYKQTQNKCLDQLAELQSQNKKINQNILHEIILKSDSHIEIDIIFKWLGARLNKDNKIQFQPKILRLGNRQFGSQISLIKKTRKKGCSELSHALTKKLISKLQFYRLVTPSHNFITVYLQLIDMMILQKGELHKAVPVLLKLSHFMNEFEIENYSVYLALMKTYIKLNELQNFIKTLQNCRLFLNKMFKNNAFIFDFQLCRIILALNTFQNPQKGLQISQILIQKISTCSYLPEELKQKYISKLIWDKSNIYMTTLLYYKAYSIIQLHLQQLQKAQNCLQGYWIQGVLYLAKAWLQMEEITVSNAVSLQKKVERAISLSLSRQLFDIAFLLKDYGEKIIQKCRQYCLPRYLQHQSGFQQTKIWFNNIKDQMLELIVEVE